MISTVTTSTVSTITTAALAGSVAGIAILVLAALLVQKELLVSVKTGGLERLKKVLNIGIMPLFFAFVVLTLVKVFEFIH